MYQPMHPLDKASNSPMPADLSWLAAEGARVWLGGHSQATKAILESRLPATHRPPTGPLDVAYIVPRSIDEAVYFADKVSTRLVSGGEIWVIVPGCASEDESPPADMLLAQAETLSSAGWRVAHRIDHDREITAMRLVRTANPAHSIAPIPPVEREKQPAMPAPHIAE